MRLLLLLMAVFVGGCATRPVPVPPSATTASLVGVRAEQLDPAYWIARQDDAQRRRMTAAAIAAQNARMVADDPAVHDLAAVPATLPRADIEAAIRALSAPPTRALFDGDGNPVPQATLDALADDLALETIGANVAPAFALVTQRADLRTFPATLRVFSTPGDTDIDRFQESALFPGTPVAVLHRSRDGAWSFVASALYRAWIESRFLASGERATVLDYATREPHVVVTGATARTVFTREQPQVSDLQLDMGVRVPLRADWPADVPVNGQHPLSSYVIELPIRGADGALALVPALLPKTADVATDYLPYTEANLLRQGFKFLGERYGWGHADGTRDCSGFVSEVYRAVGLVLPRNTGDQARSPALDRIVFEPNTSHARRLAVVRGLDVGDLVYIPGHVMMVIGRENDSTFVIHDVTGVSVRGADGAATRVPLNAVSVTPLESLLAGDGTPLVDRITAIQRVRAPTPP
ncbi:cell wall-associated NlpC family hydrolase [Chiayiivirga flava]|uniref:Cell wall-associated NlpC family hydrolase n=2 Tax=Chiayiivirga flava TaxID=659595 RepID=A0A7W8D6F2_9GAMM|nr:SH3 domain-containing protein [Chiayiivirga flava]MBB5208765.1 cell wall-associated NlpC family hydrolase [Chiayiivirga flava]